MPNPEDREQIIRETKRKLNLLYLTLSEEELSRLAEEMALFMIGLRRRYPDAYSMIMWHTLAQSTPLPQDVPHMKFDFEGEDSLVKFFEQLYKKYMHE